MKTTIVHSSHGDLVIYSHGVVSRSKSKYDDDELRNIIAFDMQEYEQTYGKPASDCDILDLGYWYDDTNGSVSYEPPAYKWRDEYRSST